MMERTFLSRIKGYYYKIKYQVIFRKAFIGNCFHVFGKLEIRGPGKIIIGKNCLCTPSLFGQDSVTLYTHTSQAKIILKNEVILRGTRFGCYTTIEIGSNTIIEGASIFDSDFHNIDATRRDLEYEKSNKRVIIQNRTYIGHECIIGKGAIIGSNAVVLPGTALSMKTIKSNSLMGGLPAKNIS